MTDKANPMDLTEDAPEQPSASPEQVDWSGEDSSYDDADTALVTRQVPWLSILQRTFVNLCIPFVNGLMLGFGEIFAHELGLVYGWRSAKVYDPANRHLLQPKRRSWLWPF